MVQQQSCCCCCCPVGSADVFRGSDEIVELGRSSCLRTYAFVLDPVISIAKANAGQFRAPYVLLGALSRIDDTQLKVSKVVVEVKNNPAHVGEPKVRQVGSPPTPIAMGVQY